MTRASSRTGSEWSVVLARFEQHAPSSVMVRTALEHAFPADWIDAVFEAERQHQYSRELLFSTVVELMSKRYGGDGAGFELTIGADADLAAKRPGW